MDVVIDWLFDNAAILFSGIGVAVLGGVIKIIFFKNKSALNQQSEDGCLNIQTESGDLKINAPINIHNQSGIDEKRAREIYTEMFAVTKRDFAAEAENKALERVQKLEDRLMPKMYQIEGALNNFADPSFLFFLTKANKAAACTDRELDYDLISELLVHRVQKKDSQKDKLGITKAVEIVDQITETSLSGLTVFYAVSQWEPVADNLESGLTLLNKLYGNLPIQDLPYNQDWLDELDILDALRTSSISTLKKLEDYWEERFSGFFAVGIKKDGEKWDIIEKKLESVNLSTSVLVDNVLIEGYLLLPIIYKNKIEKLVYQTSVDGKMVKSPITEDQKKVLYDILEMYDRSNDLKQKVKKAFVEKIDSYENLKIVRQWWNSIPHALNVTSVGRILAHVDAKRCEPSLPDLN